MKLLMITRKVDRQDHLAGFTYTWVEKIAENIEELKIICLQSGDLSGLPQNVKVFGLNKKNKLAKFWRFSKLAFELIPKVDGVFCHQNPEYAIAIAPYAKLFGKRIVAWYTHGSVSFRLRILEKLVDVILTASKESFRLPSKKVIVTGHGIDLDRFNYQPKTAKKDGFLILSVGRISPTKDYESMIKAIDFLAKKDYSSVKLDIIGDIGLKSQSAYFQALEALVAKLNLKGAVNFLGSVPNHDVPEYLKRADLFINMSGTGSIDKSVLEAMACGCLVLTCNQAFARFLPPPLMAERDNPRALAEKIEWVMNLPEDDSAQLRNLLLAEVQNHHALSGLVLKIIKQFT